ncbi:unnamed protein product [Urochloa decumbens]
MDVMNDDALRLVLERVDSHVSLIRAAAVCRQWRRAVADAAFLRRFRSLHAPPVAGYFHNGSLYRSAVMGVEAKPRDGPVFVPSSPPSVDARHFSLDFLPNGAGSWAVHDSRSSLLLMDRAGIGAGGLRDWLVCEPLTRRYTMVPQLPDFDESCRCLEAFLIDGDTDKAGGCIGMSNFRVLYMLFRGLARQAAVFAMGESGSISWSEKSIDYIATRWQFIYHLGLAGGSWYFYMIDRTLIILDGSTGEFSRSQLPITVTQDLNMWRYNFCITEGRDSKPRFFTTFGDSIKVFMRLCSGDWVLEKRVMLSEATRSLPGYHASFFNHPPIILTRGVGFIILSPGSEQLWPFSIDLETMEASPAAGDMALMVYRCELPWPPALPAMQ